MSQSFSLTMSNTRTRVIVFDILALAAIAFLPAISHMLSFPLYLIEPMRILMILAVAHTSKRNTFIIAAALPILSFVLSSHPAFFKMLLIISELTLNVWLFFYLSEKIGNNFYAALGSIFAAKIYYYVAKLLMVSIGLIAGDLVATPIYIQAIVALVLSVYIYFIFGKSAKTE